jgi:hypothetical protein
MTAAQAAPATVLQQVVAEAEKPKPRPPSTEQVSIGFFSEASFVLLNRAAAMYAAASLVPDAYKENIPNCAIALNMARRMDADPLMVMQNLYIVYGNPGWSSKFLIATFNENGAWGAMHYQFKGSEGSDDWGCRAWAIEKSTGERIDGPWVTMKIVKAEGWYDRKDRQGNFCSKWRTMPELMFMYRSAAWFIRAHAPELSMGLGTAEEHVDMGPIMDEIIDKTERRLKDQQAAKLAAIEKPTSKLDAIVDAAEASKETAQSAEATKPATPPAAQPTPQNQTAPPRQTAQEQPKPEGRGRRTPPKPVIDSLGEQHEQKAASMPPASPRAQQADMPLGNPNYSDHEY